MAFEFKFAVSDVVRDAIRNRLYEIEAVYDVRVLYAAESGSRAWGFASSDSDYDVRFVYVHRQDWYLESLLKRTKDTIENDVQPTPVGELDVCGWDLAKALDLYRNSNASIFEWLDSPIQYLEEGNVASRLFWMRVDVCNPYRLWHHYFGMVGSAIKRFEERRTVKAWLYILRPLLMTMWIEQYRTPPPMRLDKVMDEVVSDTVRRAIVEVVEAREDGKENDAFEPPAMLGDYVREGVERAKQLDPRFPKPVAQPDFGRFFRQALEETWVK